MTGHRPQRKAAVRATMRRPPKSSWPKVGLFVVAVSSLAPCLNIHCDFVSPTGVEFHFRAELTLLRDLERSAIGPMRSGAQNWLQIDPYASDSRSGVVDRPLLRVNRP
jgi:hypothetical protein